LRCSECGDTAIAVAPGTEPERVGDLFLIAKGARAHLWCLRCWLARFGEADG